MSIAQDQIDDYLDNLIIDPVRVAYKQKQINMSELKLSGNIKVINETQVISEKFSKREFVVTDNSMYPQDISFQFTQDKCGILDGYKAGQNVEVSFNLRGREWTSPTGEVKYFNTLEAWRIEGVDAPVVGAGAEQETDLPF
jgi:hypothetical protein